MKQNLPHNYNAAVLALGGRVYRKVAHNTFLMRRDAGAIAVRYHHTDVVTFYSDGRTVLDTGGWDTNTTRERIRWCGIPCCTQDGVTSIGYGGFEWVLRDGMTLYPNGTVSGTEAETPDEARRAIRAAKRRARLQRNAETRAANQKRLEANAERAARGDRPFMVGGIVGPKGPS